MDVLEGCEVRVQEHLEVLVREMYQGGIAYAEGLTEFRRAFICAALREHSGNLSKAAPALGLHRNTLTRICSDLELDARSFRKNSRRPPRSAARPALVKRAVR